MLVNASLGFTGPTALGLLSLGTAAALGETGSEHVFLMRALWFEGFALLGVAISVAINVSELIIVTGIASLIGLIVVAIAGLPIVT